MSTGMQSTREVAHRIFAAEYADATYEYRVGDDDRSPKYVLSPTGAQINRLFIVGVLTEAEWVNDETIRARVVDPTGPFVLYAGQYQPDERAILDELDKPTFVAITGKANTFKPEESDRIYTSIRPEAIAEVDKKTRDRWVVSTAEFTISRLQQLADVIDGTGESATGQAKAADVYAPTPGYIDELYTVCLDTLRLVAGKIDSVSVPTLDLNTAKESEIELTSGSTTQQSSDRVETDQETDSLADAPLDEPEAEEEPVDLDEVEEVLSDDERATIEAEFGTEFTTGDAINQPETDDSSPRANATDQSEDQPGDDEQQDIPTVITELLRELDEGDGVSKSVIHDAIQTRHGIDEERFETGLQQAMMLGKCYESEDDVFRPV